MAPSARLRVLCTGGLGYIGSHTVVQLIEAGYDVLVADNLSNASPLVEDRIRKITNATDEQLRLDLKDKQQTMQLFKEERVDAVIHYAALKAVGESVQKPLSYYENNVGGTCNLLEAMQAMAASGVKCFVFSSSATVYAPKPESKINETDPLGPSNPYGHTKVMIEQILKASGPFTNTAIPLIYFFKVQPETLMPLATNIGESPDQPNNLLPVIQHVAVGRRKCLQVYGNDWETPDGTGVRDYLHVDDLASGHLAALKKLLQAPGGTLLIHNLGTGRGYSVLELKKVFEEASGKSIPHEVVGRRPGDLACVVADPTLAEKDFNWKATRTIEEACRSAWKWQSSNPQGYA
ncbi:LOW QUALITY PROTEIN: UDP-glucose 4-epimerase, putative [Eimeria mitis]|uniref:UDP-glucose 4-epimerase n=1 Tax=Eimeria mitis TaxID=44415 RepID=U6K8J2_9EIME|nr:LOW QUALITY PROTEIN: UDP-glucose 4-epimerase, putative [Eimeria mitis]CDJ33146.1 UDP-glucose 4-epimerase, putative [Eimeria mitis]